MSRSLSTRIKEKLTGWLKKVFSKERDVVQYNTQVRQQQFLIPRDFHVVSSQIVTSNFYEIPQHQDNEPAGRRVKSFQQFLDEQQKQKDSDAQQSDSANNQQNQEQRTNRYLQKDQTKKRKLNEDKQRVCIQISNDQKEVYKVEMANVLTKEDQPSEFKILKETKNPFVQPNGKQNVMKITHEKTNYDGISTSVLEIGIDPEIPLNQLELLAKNKYIKPSVIQPMHSPKQQESTPKKKGLKRVNSNLDISQDKQEDKQNDPQTTPFFKSTRPAINVIVDKQEPNFKRDLFESLTQQIGKNRQDIQQESPKNNILQTPLINLSQLIKEDVKQQPNNIQKITQPLSLPPQQTQIELMHQPINIQQTASQTLQLLPQQQQVEQKQIIEQATTANQPQTHTLFKLGNIFEQPPLQGTKSLLFGDTIKMIDNKSEQKTNQQQTIKQDDSQQKPLFPLFNNAFSQLKNDKKDLDIKPPQLITIQDESDKQQEIKPLIISDKQPQQIIEVQPQLNQQENNLQQDITQQVIQSDLKQYIKQLEQQDSINLEQSQNPIQQVQQNQVEEPKEIIIKEESQNKIDISQTTQLEDKNQQLKEEINQKPAIIPYQWPSKFQPRPETQLIKKAANLFNNTPKPIEQQEKVIQKISESPVLIEPSPIKQDSEKKEISTPAALPSMNIDSIIEKVKQNSDKRQEQTPVKGEMSFFKSLNEAIQKQNDNQQGGGPTQITLFGNSLNSTPSIDQATPKQSLFSFLNKNDQSEQKQPQQPQQPNTQQTQQILNTGIFANLPQLFQQQSQPLQQQKSAQQQNQQQPAPQPQQQQQFAPSQQNQQQSKQPEQVNPFTIVPPKLDQAAIQGFFCKKATELQQIQSQRSSDQSQRNQLFENSTGLSLQSPLLQNPSLQVSQAGIATPMVQQSLFVQQSPMQQQFQQQNSGIQGPIQFNLFQQQGFVEQGNQMNMQMNQMNSNQMNTEVNQMNHMNQFVNQQHQGMSMEEPQHQQFTPIFNNQQIAQQYPYQYQQQSQVPLTYSQTQMDVTSGLINPTASLFFQESSVPKSNSLMRKPQDNRKRL